jgi:tetratricopeptide (TPR) repeat protein
MSAADDLERGWRFYQDKDYASAIALIEEALRGGADAALAHARLGFCHASLKQAAQAREHFTRAVELQPENGVYQRELGRDLARGGELKRALFHLGRSLATEEMAPVAYHDAAACLGILGYAELAVVCYTICGVLCDLFRSKGRESGVSPLQYHTSLQTLQRRLSPAHYTELQTMVYTKLGMHEGPDDSLRIPADAFRNMAAEVGPELVKIGEE